MTYRGTVRNGVVELEDASGLRDGTVVRVEPLAEPQDEPGRGHARLMKLAGVIKDKPPDWARNHDHYLHGHPKQ
jgi:hypothetical protein